jgi:hypothetical protein
MPPRIRTIDAPSNSFRLGLRISHRACILTRVRHACAFPLARVLRIPPSSYACSSVRDYAPARLCAPRNSAAFTRLGESQVTGGHMIAPSPRLKMPASATE